MPDFFKYSLNFKRVDLVNFTGDEHRLNSCDMQFGWLYTVSLCIKIAIHYLNAIKISLICKFIRSGNFYHPIDHPSSKMTINLMIF